MHQHDHSHHKDESASRIAMAFFLNVGFTIIEFIGGWLTNSTAIMADSVNKLNAIKICQYEGAPSGMGSYIGFSEN